MDNRVREDEEEYFDEREPKLRVLDERALREPVSVLEPNRPVCVERGTTIADAVRQMQEHHIGCVVVTEGGRLVGIFTERDVLSEVVGKLDPSSTPVDGSMTPDPEALAPDASIAFALNKMSLGGFRHVPIVDSEGRPVGIVSVKDIVDYIVSFFSSEVLTVPPEPGLDVARSREGA